MKEKKYWEKIGKQCAWCKKEGIIKCPDCGWEACEDHSRSDGKCIYCTRIGVTINKEAVDFIKSLES